MKAMLHAFSFFLICVLAYYVAVVIQREEKQSPGKHSESPHRSQKASGSAPAPVEEPPLPLRDAERQADVPVGDPAAEEENQQLPSLQGVTTAPDHDADVPDEVPGGQEEENQQPHPLARGWGADIDWVETYEEGLKVAKASQKPLMVIHHLENCPVCKDLKAGFSSHEEIQRMAKEDFIMFNLVHETEDRNLAPDGYYVPRILFIDPAMVIRADIATKSENYRYSYTHNDMQLLMENMKKAKTPPEQSEL
ncbi:hypothetical protein ANANG_G00280560 [Anguilla anguilla]|uniref:Thioredoxin domain-containing protein n=1 Tax=Anguilla anguilla TaxID=7936 RepID=A0A9D3RNA6_ANGAN|nr:hypothetical protein ANANG_G00280560 [Anguilla anguilla]